FHDDERLLGVAATDCLPQGLSSVYTFFDPDVSTQRGLGTFAVLWQIEYAKSLGLEYVYPGYWIADSDKMRYKTDFQPIQGYIDNEWVSLKRS
ncbi:MAG: arginyltransferase, partial [Thiolinea sp.]